MKSTIHLSIIDDDLVYRYALTLMLNNTRYNIDITEFNNGREGIEFLCKNSDNIDLLPDIILLDLNMPVMNGWEFLNEFGKIEQSIFKSPSIFIVTSSILKMEIDHAKTYHFVKRFLSKPIFESEVDQILATFIQDQNGQLIGGN